MKNLFIDSNIWLSLYHFTNDDLAQFSKLKELNGTDIRLFIPQQVYDEVQRNREAKLKDAFKSFEVKRIQFPVFCKEYEEYKQFNDDYNDLIRRYSAWKGKIDTDVQNKSLPADKTIIDFFESSDLLECNSVVEKAYMRYRIGNPPGKDNKYGDAINWECLLQAVPNNEDLYFISSDKDYRSEIYDSKINPFLENEWKCKKRSNIFFYTNLVPFLNEHFKDIQLKTEQEKQELIERLQGSHNFECTHGIIAMLSKHTGWTDTQIEALCAAAENNDQIGRIMGDIDVLSFYSSLLSKVQYGKLPDCSTRRAMEWIFASAIENEKNAVDDYEAEVAEALEDFYKH